jgi:ribosomal protein S11
MKTFVVNSAILNSNTDAKACAVGAPKMLKDAGIENVKVKSCYCCGEEGRVVFIMIGDSRDAVLEAFQKVNVPVASIMETTEVPPNM